MAQIQPEIEAIIREAEQKEATRLAINLKHMHAGVFFC